MLKFILVFLSSSLFGAVIDGEATSTLVDGVAKVYIGTVSEKISNGSVITAGKNIKTEDKSKVELFISNGIRLVMLPNSSLHIKTLKQTEGTIIKPNPENKSVKETGPSITEFEVESGKVLGDVKKLAPMSVFTLKTPAGVVKIKGTTFSVEYNLNKDGTASFNVGCLTGRIEVQMADPRIPPVTVPAGQQMSCSASPSGFAGPKDGPPPKMEVKQLPPSEVKQISVSAGVPPPPPQQPNAPPPAKPPAVEQALDRVVQSIANEVMQGQVDPSPTGG
jgi:hypothetical protein